MERRRWRRTVVGIATLNVVWSLAGVLSGERFTVGPASGWVLFGGALLLLTPVFYYALYRLTGAVRAADGPWRPNPRVWTAGGVVVSLLGAVAFLNPMTHYVAGLYLVQRARKSTGAPPQARPGGGA